MATTLPESPTEAPQTLARPALLVDEIDWDRVRPEEVERLASRLATRGRVEDLVALVERVQSEPRLASVLGERLRHLLRPTLGGHDAAPTIPFDRAVIDAFRFCEEAPAFVGLVFAALPLWIGFSFLWPWLPVRILALVWVPIVVVLFSSMLETLRRFGGPVEATLGWKEMANQYRKDAVGSLRTFGPVIGAVFAPGWLAAPLFPAVGGGLWVLGCLYLTACLPALIRDPRIARLNPRSIRLLHARSREEVHLLLSVGSLFAVSVFTAILLLRMGPFMALLGNISVFYVGIAVVRLAVTAADRRLPVRLEADDQDTGREHQGQ